MFIYYMGVRKMIDYLVKYNLVIIGGGVLIGLLLGYVLGSIHEYNKVLKLVLSQKIQEAIDNLHNKKIKMED